MFLSKKKDREPGSAGANEVGLLGVDSQFKGVLRFRGTLRIDGSVAGAIISEEGSGSVLIINQNAIVRADIISDAVLLGGTVEGNIKAEQRVEIYRSGNLKGDIFTNSVMIEGGATFVGNCHMLKDLDPKRREMLLHKAFSRIKPAGADRAEAVSEGGAGTAAEPATA